MGIHKMRRMGRDSSGDKVGVEFSRDDLRVEGILDDDGELTERPQVEVAHVDDGEWRITILDGE